MPGPFINPNPFGQLAPGQGFLSRPGMGGGFGGLPVPSVFQQQSLGFGPQVTPPPQDTFGLTPQGFGGGAPIQQNGGFQAPVLNPQPGQGQVGTPAQAGAPNPLALLLSQQGAPAAPQHIGVPGGGFGAQPQQQDPRMLLQLLQILSQAQPQQAGPQTFQSPTNPFISAGLGGGF